MELVGRIRYILGVRMRRQKEVTHKVLARKGDWSEVQPARQMSKYPAPLKVREVRVGKRRYIVCLNEEERVQDAKAREAIVEKLRSQLKAGAKALVGNKGYRRFLRAQGKEAFSVDEESVKTDAIYDGMWVLRTNTELETEVVARAYKSLWIVEDLFRTTKTILETRPICRRFDETIRGLAYCTLLAFLSMTNVAVHAYQNATYWIRWIDIYRQKDLRR